MDRDEEKDLYIKAKLKDGHIPEKIDNLFNNSAKLIENIEPPKKNKNQVIFKRVAAVAACAIIALGGGNIYATTQGYDNVFFMIKEWIAPSKDAQGKDNILSDRDITISYKSIEVAKGIKMQINRLVVKDNEAKLHLKIDQAETELTITPFTYIVRDEDGNEICNYTSTNKEMIYSEELKLNGLKKDAKKLELEVKQNDNASLVKFDIDLENKEIQVIGNEQDLQKISEEELKKYLSAFAFLNYEDDTLNIGTVGDKETLENERNMFVAKEIAKVKDLEFYNGTTTMGMHSYDLIDTKVANNIMKSVSDIELEDDGLVKLWNTYFTKSNVDGKMRYVDIPNPDMTITSLCIDVTDIMYSNGIYTVTFTYCYPTTEDIDENRVEDLPVYEMTIGLTINEDQTYSKYHVSSKMEGKLIKAGKVEDENVEVDEEIEETEISEKCKSSLEKYLLILGKAEGSPESILDELGIMSYEEYNNIRNNQADIQGNYVKTTIKYENFKNEMLKYMTEELYENQYGKQLYKDLDGYLGVLNAGATGISFEIVTMELTASTTVSYTYEVEYKEDPYEGPNQKMLATLEDLNGNYVVSKIEYLNNKTTTPIEPTVDEDLKKFIGEWQLDYIMTPGTPYGYEFSISSVRGSDKRVTLTIKQDGTFVEFIQDTGALMGKYIKINENTIKRTYNEDGFVVYTTCEENKLGEIVISNTCKTDQRKYEYYTKEDNTIKESLVGNWWRSYNVDHEEKYEFNLRILSDGTFVESTMQEADENGTRLPKETGNGTYKIIQEGAWDVVELTYDNGEVHKLLYGEKGSAKDNQTKLHYSAGKQVFEKFITVDSAR